MTSAVQVGTFVFQHPMDTWQTAHTVEVNINVLLFCMVVHLHKYSLPEPSGRKEMLYLTTHSAHFIYGYTASDIW